MLCITKITSSTFMPGMWSGTKTAIMNPYESHMPKMMGHKVIGRPRLGWSLGAATSDEDHLCQ